MIHQQVSLQMCAQLLMAAALPRYALHGGHGLDPTEGGSGAGGSSPGLSDVRDSLFYAKFQHSAQIIKTIAQTLEAAGVGHVTFVISGEGIYIVEFDPASTVLFEIWLPKTLFLPYKFDASLLEEGADALYVTMEVGVLQSQLTSISRKNSIIFRILPESPYDMIFSIRVNDKAGRAEERRIVGKPAVDYVVSPVPEEENYYSPVPIESAFFGGIKKITHSIKTLSTTIIGSNYIAFSSEIERMSSSKIESGVVTSEDDPEYHSTFRVENFNQLSKLSSMNLPMRVSAPVDPAFPLRIDCILGEAGRIRCFIKNTETIDQEAEQRHAEMAAAQTVLGETPTRRSRKKAVT